VSTPSLATRVERGIRVASLTVVALLLYGWKLAPSVDPAAPFLVLAGYGIVAHRGLRALEQGDRKILHAIVICGILAAAVSVPSILIEYAGRTVDNRLMLGSIAALCAMAGAFAAWRTTRICDGVFGATLSAMIGSLASVMAVLAPYYVLRGTAVQDRFFLTEGDYDDFARSGMTDFNTWVIGDLFGGTFFHLLLGALVAAAIGGFAGIAALGCRRLAARGSNPTGT
jgi:hypothetical protein